MLRGRLGKALGSIVGVLDTLGSAWKLRQRFGVFSKHRQEAFLVGFEMMPRSSQEFFGRPREAPRGLFVRVGWFFQAPRDVGSEGARNY